MYYLDTVGAVQHVVIVIWVVHRLDLVDGSRERVHAFSGGIPVLLAEGPAIARRAHAVAVGPLVAVVKAYDVRRAVLVALVDDVGEFDVEEAEVFAVTEKVQLGSILCGDRWKAILGEILF